MPLIAGSEATIATAADGTSTRPGSGSGERCGVLGIGAGRRTNISGRVGERNGADLLGLRR